MKQNVNQAVSQQLPPFNKEIQILIPVNEIYQELLKEFPEDYKHREIVAHAIIGTAEVNGGLGYIFSALRGHMPNINFAVGDMVECTARERRRRWNDGTEESPNFKHEDVEVGLCEVVEINFYAPKKVKVKFIQDVHTYGNAPTKTAEVEEWVDVRTCTKWAQPESDYNRIHA